MSEKTASQDNVVSLFAARENAKKGVKATQNVEASQKDEDLSFEEIIRRNKETADRMKRDRKKSNKSVLRSYRIKN